MSKRGDNSAVSRFAVAMRMKLAKKRAEGRAGWDDPSQCSIGDLRKMLAEHIKKGDMVDVGNFAMMIWNREQNDRRSSEILESRFGTEFFDD